ncbi:hypothetical protein AB3329_07845 [Streptococcus sp. H31]|uniref:hypothetical protein n=1 Tax=Streptococcus huangxiaojuni TaxID=3237239 RepID=UPI0034A35351
MEERKKLIAEQKKRIEHFQWIANCLAIEGKSLYLESDWFDHPVFISEADAKAEVEYAQKKLELLYQKSSIRRILRLLHQLFHR